MVGDHTRVQLNRALAHLLKHTLGDSYRARARLTANV